MIDALKWKFAAARATGTSHVRFGLPCQDRAACSSLEGRGFFAVLADGAGSADHGAEGADLAVVTVLSHVQELFSAGQTDSPFLLRSAANAARSAVLAAANARGLEPRCFASTLLAILVTPKGGAAMQIGDGVIVVRRERGEWCWIFWPQRGIYVNTTFFLTDEDALTRLQVDSLSPGIMDVAVISDGLESLALQYATQAVHEPFFNGLIQPLAESDGIGEVLQLSRQLDSFLCSKRIQARTDDDLSIVVGTSRCEVVRQ